MAIFLNFDWFLVVSFVFSANQKLFVICTCVTEELYSFLSQSELGNFFVYISCILYIWNTQGLNQLPFDPSEQTLSLWIS